MLTLLRPFCIIATLVAVFAFGQQVISSQSSSFSSDTQIGIFHFAIDFGTKNKNRPPVPRNMDEIRASIGYPSHAKDAGIEGEVVLRVLVDEKGAYVKHTIMESFHPLLRIPCELHAPLIEFEPAIRDGEEVAAWVILPFAFTNPNTGA